MTSVGGNIIEARKVVDALSILRSRDSDAIYLAIQILLQKTSDNDVEIVSLEKYPQLLPTVVDIMNEYNPLKSIYTSTIEFKEPGPIDYANDLFSGMGRIESWPERIHFLDNSRYKHLAGNIDANKILLSMLVIIRNVSFEVNNALTLAQDADLLVHLCSLTHTIVTNRSVSDACRFALDILSNVGHRISLTGYRRWYNVLWMNDMNLSNSNKVGRPLSIAPTERSVGKEYRENCFYVHVARCLLSLVYEVAQLSDRSVAIRALDIICQLSLLADNAVVFQHAPPLFFQLLVDMLNCSITASDPFRNHHYLQGMEKISTLLRPPPAALSTSFHAHLCDGEVRDVALETIQALCSNSKALRAMFGRVPGIFSTLCNIVQACLAASRAGFNVNSLTVGTNKSAAMILSMLCSHPANKDAAMAFQPQLCALGFADETIAEFLSVHGQTVFGDNYYYLSNEGIDTTGF